MKSDGFGPGWCLGPTRQRGRCCPHPRWRVGLKQSGWCLGPTRQRGRCCPHPRRRVGPRQSGWCL